MDVEIIHITVKDKRTTISIADKTLFNLYAISLGQDPFLNRGAARASVTTALQLALEYCEDMHGLSRLARSWMVLNIARPNLVERMQELERGSHAPAK